MSCEDIRCIQNKTPFIGNADCLHIVGFEGGNVFPFYNNLIGQFANIPATSTFLYNPLRFTQEKPNVLCTLGKVTIQGNIKWTNIDTSGAIIFELPQYYRPSKTLVFRVPYYRPSDAKIYESIIYISPNGLVAINTAFDIPDRFFANDEFYLANISFFAEQ